LLQLLGVVSEFLVGLLELCLEVRSDRDVDDRGDDE
jgi:hypothetical protein